MEKNSDYSLTTSFYNTQEVFQKYLGSTSYYSALQEAVSKIARLANITEVLDLGFGTGDTVVRLAKENPSSSFYAVDMRKEMVDILNTKCKQERLDNIIIQQDDLSNYVANTNKRFCFINMLYSFHHIPDPLEKKIAFLHSAFEALKEGGLLFIGETFIPSLAKDLNDVYKIRELWDTRALEGYGSTFWNSLKGLSKKEINHSKNIAEYCMEFERRAGKSVENRDNEYLVKVDWLTKKASKIGYNVLLSEPINSVGEYGVLLKKEIHPGNTEVDSVK